jgi:cytochrome c-type biogenesis protein CcmH
MLARLIAVWLLLLSGLVPAMAVLPGEQLADPKLETRARELSRGLRCLVCQNQTIDDSDAPLARDLRVLVRERLSAGDSDDQVIRFVVQRYGDFVLMKPPFNASTLLLWLSPLLMLLAGAALAFGWFRRQARMALSDPSPLTAEEAARLAALTARDKGELTKP